MMYRVRPLSPHRLLPTKQPERRGGGGWGLSKKGGKEKAMAESLPKPSILTYSGHVRSMEMQNTGTNYIGIG
jgi:hypothetical protein